MDRERAGCWQVTAQTNDAAVCRSPCGAAIPCANAGYKLPPHPLERTGGVMIQNRWKDPGP